jgi:hypothetical protein
MFDEPRARTPRKTPSFLEESLLASALSSIHAGNPDRTARRLKQGRETGSLHTAVGVCLVLTLHDHQLDGFGLSSVINRALGRHCAMQIQRSMAYDAQAMMPKPDGLGDRLDAIDRVKLWSLPIPDMR